MSERISPDPVLKSMRSGPSGPGSPSAPRVELTGAPPDSQSPNAAGPVSVQVPVAGLTPDAITSVLEEKLMRDVMHAPSQTPPPEVKVELLTP